MKELQLFAAAATDRKLFRQLLNSMVHVDGSNNYEKTVMEVTLYNDGIVVETACRNEYGGLYGNNDRQFVAKATLPNYAARKLYLN